MTASLRCIALGLRLDPQRARTPQSFAASLADTLDARLGPTAGTDAPPTLLALPEHTGLLAMLAGERGAAARERAAAGGTTLEVLGALAEGHGAGLGRVSARFPQVASPGQLLHLAVVDTVVRTLLDTAVEVARARGWWVSVGAALPPWQEVAIDREPDLADPSLHGEDGPATVAVATRPEVHNRNLIVAPDGRLAAVQDKAYLVPVERDAAGGLGLTAVGLDAVRVAALPIGRVAAVISKDAWMPDVNERLEQLGAQLLLQPEAFDRWGVVDRDADEGADLWPPDKFQRGGWWMVQRHPAFRANVTAMLIGGLGELAFDGQPLIAVPAPAGTPGLGLLGQAPAAGWADVGRWVHAAQPPADLADPDRRARFEQQAAAPPVDDADTLAVAEVELPGPPAEGELPPVGAAVAASTAVSGPGLHLVPDLCSDGARAWLAWIARDRDHEQAVRVAHGDAQGWAPPETVDPVPDRLAADGDEAAPDVAQRMLARRWRPRVAIVAGRPVAVALSFAAESWDLVASRRGRDGWTPAARLDDADLAAGVRRERGHDAPAVVAVGDELVAVWADLRWPWTLPQVRLSRSADAGRSWGPSVRVDGGPLEGPSDPLAPPSPYGSGGQTTPAAAVSGAQVLVAWTDHGGGAGPVTRLARVDHPDADPVALDLPAGPRPAHRPALAADGARVWLVEEQPGDDGGLVVRTSTDRGRSFGPPRTVDGERPGGSRLRRAVLLADGDRAVLVAEDERGGRGSVVAGELDEHGACSALQRIDDAPPGAQARVPTAARVGDQLVVAWQDTRDGEVVRATWLPLAALRGR